MIYVTPLVFSLISLFVVVFYEIIFHPLKKVVGFFKCMFLSIVHFVEKMKNFQCDLFGFYFYHGNMRIGLLSF